MVEPDVGQRLVVVAGDAARQQQVAVGRDDGIGDGSVLHRVGIAERQSCRLLAIVDGQHILAEIQAVDAYDVATPAHAVDNDRTFVGNGTPLALHRYRSGRGQQRDDGFALLADYLEDSQLTGVVGCRQEIGVMAYAAGIAAEGLVGVDQPPLL